MSPHILTLIFHIAIVLVYIGMGVYVLVYGIPSLSTTYSNIFGVALFAYAGFRVWRARRNQVADEGEE
jgi:threonine/homoserine/homoserine lactone efflux protein